MWARLHRWLAITLVVFLAVWSVTGLVFHLKPGWARAYDMLTIERRQSTLAVASLASLAAVEAAAGGAASVTKLELFDTAVGPLYRVATASGPVLVDARAGTRISPLDEAAARTLVGDAVRRSAHHAAYGEIAGITLEPETVLVRFSGGPVVELSRRDGRVSQRGPDTDRIDWLYRIHYLQWTGHTGTDRALAVAGLALIWAVVIPGLVLFVRAMRRRRGAAQ